MSVKEDLLQGVRTWLKDVSSLSDDEVIVEREWNAERPDKPYLGVRLTTTGEPTFDEIIEGDKNSEYSQKQHGGRRGVATVNGYGQQTAEWIEVAQNSLKLKPVKDVFQSIGMTVKRSRGGLSDVTELVGPSFESRVTAEFDVRYRIVGDDQQVAPAVDKVSFEFDFEDPEQNDTVDENFTAP